MSSEVRQSFGFGPIISWASSLPLLRFSSFCGICPRSQTIPTKKYFRLMTSIGRWMTTMEAERAQEMSRHGSQSPIRGATLSLVALDMHLPDQYFAGHDCRHMCVRANLLQLLLASRGRCIQTGRHAQGPYYTGWFLDVQPRVDLVAAARPGRPTSDEH